MWTQSILTVVLAIGAVSCLPHPRIINGTDSDIEKYPFMVSIRWISYNNRHMCGGTIINSRWILTLNSGLIEFEPPNLSVQYGVTKIGDNGLNLAYVNRIIRHEEYGKFRPFPNNIALLELKEELVFNYKTVAPVTLPESYFEIPQNYGALGTVIGWGHEKFGGTNTEHLQEVNLNIYPDDKCQTLQRNVTSHQLCAGTDEVKNFCGRDDGGPLLYEGRLQLGIVSYNTGPCETKGVPGVYTKVSHYIDWIREKIN